MNQVITTNADIIVTKFLILGTAVQVVTFLTCIPVLLGSNLSRDTEYVH
jgi:hypothetical protein